MACLVAIIVCGVILAVVRKRGIRMKMCSATTKNGDGESEGEENEDLAYATREFTADEVLVGNDVVGVDAESYTHLNIYTI